MSRTSASLILSAALAALICVDAPGATAQSSPPTQSGSPTTEKLEEVTVTARRAELAPRIRKFVNQIAVPENGGADGIARWQQPSVCPLVSGLPRQHGEYILERLSEIAQAAGVPLAGEHCRPNLYILLTPRPEDLLRGMEKRNRGFTFGFDASEYPPIPTPVSLVNEFIETPRVVRAWYNSTEKDPWGKPLTYCVVPCDHASKSVCEHPIQCGSGVAGGSHTVLSAMMTFSRVFVIVDETRLRGVTFGQLADYVAMVSLAKLNPDVRLGDTPTILRLFNGAPQAAPAGMTDWDRAFLKSLYATEQLSKMQKGEIARAMVRDIIH